MAFQLAGDRYRGCFADALPHNVAEAWIGGAHLWFDEPEHIPAAWWKKDVALIDSPLGRAVAKRVSNRKPAFIRRRRAARMFAHAMRLASAGVDIAQPLAVLIPKRRGDPALYVEEFLDLPTLNHWALDGAPGDRVGLTEALAHNLVRLHRGSMRDRDLKGGNVLVDSEAPARAIFIDLEGVRARDEGARPYGLRTRARDLARLLQSLLLYDALDDGVWRPLLEIYAERMGDDPAAIDARARPWALAHIERNKKRKRPVT